MLTFKSISIAMATLSLTLSVSLMFAPSIIFMIFEVSSNDVADFIARRAGMMFLGLGVMHWLARNADHSQLRQAVCIGMLVLMGGLSILGLGEFSRGFGGIGILAAAIGEAAFALGYLTLLRESIKTP